MFANIHNVKTKRLNSWLKHCQKLVDHKTLVMNRHPAGTPWHTRAVKEIETISHIIKRINAELERRGE